MSEGRHAHMRLNRVLFSAFDLDQGRYQKATLFFLLVGFLFGPL